MITRLESCTRDTASPASTERGRVLSWWDIALGVCTVAYLTLVLFDDVESPLLSLALIVLVAYALIQPHLRNR